MKRKRLQGGELSEVYLLEEPRVVLKKPIQIKAGKIEKQYLDEIYKETKITPQVLGYQEKTGTIKMEYIENVPNKNTHSREIYTILEKIHKKAEGNYPTLEEQIEQRIAWAKKDIKNKENKYSVETIKKAIEDIRKMVKEPSKTGYLLHGDFQDKNILRTIEGNLRVIDPLPCIGDPIYDLSLYLATTENKVNVKQYARIFGIEYQTLKKWVKTLKILDNKG